jgi:hypothetical protein
MTKFIQKSDHMIAEAVLGLLLHVGHVLVALDVDQLAVALLFDDVPLVFGRRHLGRLKKNVAR